MSYWTLESLVREIRAINSAWKAAREYYGSGSQVALALRETKSALQFSLLRDPVYKVYLKVDTDVDDTTEELFGIHLPQAVDGVWDAAHLPVRVAQEHFTDEELARLTNKANNS